MAGVPRSKARASNPASNHSQATGRRKPGGTRRSETGGAPAPAVVVMVSTSVTADEPLTVTEGEAKAQVAPVGQPLATLRVTAPVNPLCGLTLRVEVPACPGAEMVTGEGFAERAKSLTVADDDAEVEVP